jgi:hypothetical protein
MAATFTFKTPCPYWKDPNGPRICEALKLIFGKVLLEHEDSEHDPTGFLSLLLASMVFHSSWMLEFCADHSHTFNKIPLLSSPFLPS